MVWVTKPPLEWLKLRGTDVWISIVACMLSFVVAVFSSAVFDSLYTDSDIMPEFNNLQRASLDIASCMAVFFILSVVSAVTVCFFRRAYSHMAWGTQYLITVSIIGFIMALIVSTSVSMFACVILRYVIGVEDLFLSLIVPVIVLTAITCPIFVFGAATLTRGVQN
ncbi:hypothetical protein J8273_8505 [Carpediemonas membranifera]|uniref:Uncharacterized protein n=1 Tax=Carpediemonas membranifera TaxID=201153 RepID=A0A8J6BU00_9EUKA|nr:hypothetical protein J8273_8505 [Carpediemonas membranifera]|eukprot:KAG9389826.1 hypothetical protein J8273_8505 [Carpediemonas membranifera]